MTKAPEQNNHVKAKRGDTVKVHYRGTLEDGTQFASTTDHEPLEFTIGEGKLIRGFQRAVIGMSPGDTKIQKLAAPEAYGPHKKELVFRVDRSRVPSNINLEPGQCLTLHLGNKKKKKVSITEVSESSVILDANHHLAGQNLEFHIRLIEIGS